MKDLTFRGLTGDIAAVSFGNPRGMPLVAVHGWLDNAASFESLAQQIPDYNWLAVDLPGHGRSDHRPPGCIYHFTDYVADLHHVTQEIGNGPITLVGHSLGAGIAATFAAAYPGRVEKLVLIDGIGPISGEDDDSLAQLRKSMAHLESRENARPRIYPDWDFLVRRRMEAGDIARSSVETLLGRGAEQTQEGVRVLSDGRLKQHSPIYMSQKKVLSILGGIQCPTLLVLAEQGLVHSRESTPDRIAAVPNLRVVRVPGAHHVHLDDPGIVAAQMSDFLSHRGQPG